jgi:hypothetical protein
MKHLALATAAALLCTGCAGPKPVPLDLNAAVALKGQEVAVTARAEKPGFTAMTPLKAQLALVGAFLMIKDGNEIVRNNNVPDPAVAISKALAKHLEQTRGMGVVSPAINVSSDDPEHLSAAVNGMAKYVLDVNTTNWMFTYIPTEWNRYEVTYMAMGRLIDAETKKVVASAFCKDTPESNGDAPTYDQLVANNAAWLKKKLAHAADNCIATFKREMLPL